jgi:TatD DNase family protein
MHIDGHCHLDLPIFDDTRNAVRERARAAGIEGFILAGVEAAGWPGQQALTQRWPRTWWTAGIHPWKAPGATVDALEAALVHAPVAIGEIGLDGHGVHRSTLPLQVPVFRAQLALARARNLPVVLHVVRAHGRALDIVRRDGLPAAGGVLHHFVGPPGRAQAWLDLGLHLGFVGASAAAAMVPLSRLILESDADTPGKREPAEIARTAASVAALRDSDPDVILNASTANIKNLYRLP